MWVNIARMFALNEGEGAVTFYEQTPSLSVRVQSLVFLLQSKCSTVAQRMSAVHVLVQPLPQLNKSWVHAFTRAVLPKEEYNF